MVFIGNPMKDGRDKRHEEQWGKSICEQRVMTHSHTGAIMKTALF